MPLPEVLSSEIVYHGYFDLRVDRLKYPGGAESDYTILEINTPAAVALAVTPEGQYIINQEYRHPTKERLLSLPGGRLDPMEAPLSAAQRELLEETGYQSSEWLPLNTLYPFPAITCQKIHFFLALNARRERLPSRDPSELISTELMDLDTLKQAIAKGTALDGILCTAFFLKNLHNL